MTTQYDGHFVEPIGLIKMDFLGLRTLSIIKTCLENIKKSKHLTLNADEIPLDDTETFQLFARGETTGLFQFESPGMKKHLRALQPNRFEDLVAMNALYRPGPMEYIPSFIRRKHGEEPIEYDHPMMEPFLKDTYGVTVYQEQVMLQSRALGLFTRGQSDTLRKAMGKKQLETMAQLKGKFMEGCKNNPEFVKGAQEKGKDVEELVNKIWSDWEAFASYAFNKSHSVCYAYIAYQTGYLKAHYPAEFMAANLSNNLSDITKVTVFMDECKRMGLSVLAPDVNESYNDFTVNTHGQIRFGMAAIKGVGEAAVETIIKEREKNGAYKNVYDFFERIDYRAVNKKTLENLITAGGLDSFGYHRAQLLRELNPGMPNTLTQLDTLINYGQKKQQDALSMQASLFGDLEGFDVVKPTIPECEPWHDYEKSKKEKDLIGIYLTSHPLDPYKLEMQYLCTPLEELANGLEPLRNKELTIAGIITAKREGKTKNGKDFGILTLEDFGGTYELAFFGKDYAKFHQYFIHETAVYVKGKVGDKWGRKDELAFNITDMGLLESIAENAIRSITIQVNVTNLTSEIITEMYNLFVTNDAHKQASGKGASGSKSRKNGSANPEEEPEKQTEIPLYFDLYYYSGNNVNMFSRTCKAVKSMELYAYFENNEAVRMRIN